MYIDEIRDGTAVNLEMIKDDRVFEVSTIAVGTSEDKVLLRPFMYKGQVLDLGNRGFSSVVFNIYTNDEDGNRVGWNAVHIRLVEYRGKKYYAVTASEFNKISTQSDRRNHARIVVETDGHILCQNSGVDASVRIHDVSDVGIAVLSKKRLDIRGMYCRVEFMDCVNDTDYHLEIDCRCVREEAQPAGGYLYGFSIGSASHDMLSYVYIQKILERSGTLK
ncbi:MAG: hypothetical protein E7282_01465 [Lachnospiraceae bacterium]|nr:hypothetical protein [Lachnospiraceae bacterium]